MNKNAHLLASTLYKDVPMAATRDGYGIGVVEAGTEDERVVVLCADLTESTRSQQFSNAFPKRFIEMGVAEQNMAVVATGLALNGKIPFIATYAVFSPGRNWDQIRISACYNNVHIIFIGAHAGISVGPDGATHQAMEDIALTRTLPHMTVLVPCDSEEARKAVHAAKDAKGPVYIRLGRNATPKITSEKTPFTIGKAQIFKEGNDVAIIGAGPIIHSALVAARTLAEQGISCRVINMPSIKPIDADTIEQAARDCKAVVTVEEHQIMGGVGSAIAEVIAQTYPVPMEFIGMHNSFGESGTPEELLKKYRMDAPAIEEAVRKVFKRKKT
ncbi:MAG: transketolase [Candidatus Andersenbacteria bacterium RIFCSPHIGHO2_12_FULL_45_11b]|uniref:Transketolase n=1 Tax=Candidatus Andersenbacteria bacterium RIFCSPHIGHO2_12_FULL_45_11b TaxID=1797282 RepID=A0A1G1XB94_9BACT|nr:MAG: transketolase [Candidatus Andersenbacteria bacterium RIFCSPHIGHO2_12_FULL_45_11b]